MFDPKQTLGASATGQSEQKRRHHLRFGHHAEVVSAEALDGPSELARFLGFFAIGRTELEVGAIESLRPMIQAWR
jgi:hypothetical protein